METNILGIWISIFLDYVFWRDSEFCPQGVWGNAGGCVLFLKSAKMKIHFIYDKDNGYS
jgi:hypothetical protein